MALVCGAIFTAVSFSVGAQTPPALPVPRAPVEYFRELLAMTPGQRSQALATKTPEFRRGTLEKLNEYEAMPAAERDWRLWMVQLRWYLVPLMKIAPADRTALLSRVSPEYRPVVEERLRHWDALTEESRREFLENENRIHYVLRLESGSPEQREKILQGFSVENRKQIEAQLAEWHKKPLSRRQEMYRQFHEFFELGPREREKMLSVLSDSERAQMQKTLETFAQLRSEQRRKCIESFREFVNMTPEERASFLKTAERWEAMSPSQRQAWREIVRGKPVFPPLPPGFGNPPMPPRFQVATNEAVFRLN
jgi:hypothetical protein